MRVYDYSSTADIHVMGPKVLVTTSIPPKCLKNCSHKSASTSTIEENSSSQ